MFEITAKNNFMKLLSPFKTVSTIIWYINCVKQNYDKNAVVLIV